jgi:hypothetical protein
MEVEVENASGEEGKSKKKAAEKPTMLPMT